MPHDPVARDVSVIRDELRRRRVVLNSPLSPESVSRFEARLGVSLPEDYREFLSDVGNGGAGPPSYGLLRLGETPRGSVPDWFAAGYDQSLARAFPLTAHWVWEGGPETPEIEARIQELRFGNLCLGTDGCGIFWLLIVTGRERGQIWWLTDVGAQPLAPRHTFLSWYGYWLGGGSDWFREFIG